MIAPIRRPPRARHGRLALMTARLVIADTFLPATRPAPPTLRLPAWLGWTAVAGMAAIAAFTVAWSAWWVVGAL